MESRVNHEFETDYLKSTKIGSLIVLEPKADGFDTLVDVHIGPKTIEWFEAIGNDKSIRGILVIIEGDLFGEQSFSRHLSKLTGEEINTGNPVIVKKILDKDRRSIQINMMNSYIRTILSLPQIVFISLTNTVVSPFWGASLACDFRIAHPNLVIHLNSREFGLHPSAGVPFFMIRQAGLSKAKELLFGERFIYAEGAKNLGMINFITSHDNYRSDAIGKAVEILETTTYDYFYYTKKLMNANIIKEFESYINLEEQMEMH